jgi:hypothetical protein
VELTEELKALFIETAKSLKGFARRRFQAQTVKALGDGGQRLAERELGWNRQTLRKAAHELESGFACIGDIGRRRPKRAEERLPKLLADIRAIVDGQSQTDPQFRSTRLYTRLSAAEVRRQLILQKGYLETELPTVRTIRTKLNDLGYHPKRVAKTKPLKRSHKLTRSSNASPS